MLFLNHTKHIEPVSMKKINPIITQWLSLIKMAVWQDLSLLVKRNFWFSRVLCCLWLLISLALLWP